MEEEKKQGLSRRAFLGLGGTALAGRQLPGWRVRSAKRRRCGQRRRRRVHRGGTTGGMPVAESSEASAGPDVAGMHSWEIAPEAISADKIANTEDCDVARHRRGSGRLLRHHRRVGRRREEGHHHRQEP